MLRRVPTAAYRLPLDAVWCAVSMRESGALTPAGCAGFQVPLLEVDGKPLLQSNAQATYCAKLAGLCERHLRV